MAKNNTKAEIMKLGKIRTPKAVAAFAYLTKPDDSFNKLRHRITLTFDKADPEWKAFVLKFKEYAKKAGVKQLPIKQADEKHAKSLNVEVGTPYLEFESKVQDADNVVPVPVFGADGKPADGVFVYGGDIVRVEGTVVRWDLPTGSGLKAYLNAVQLLKSNYRNQAGASFEAEEEFLTDDAASPEAEDDGLEEEGSSFEEESAEDADPSEEADDSDPTAGLM